MDFKNIGEKFLQSVKAGRARSFILSSSSDRPEIPARAAAAAAVAKSLVGTPPHERLSIASTSGEAPSVYSAKPRGEVAEPLEEDYFEKDFDPVRYLLEHLPEQPTQEFFENKVTQRMLQLDNITEELSKQVMEHHEEMVKGMQMVTEVEKDLQISKIICKNGRRRLGLAMNEVSRDLVVAGNVKKKQVLMEILPILERIQYSIEIKARLDSTMEEGNYGKALQMCSECLQLLEECSELAAVQDMNRSIEEWLQKAIVKVDAVLLEVCKQFDAEKYMTVIDAYAMIDDVGGLADKIQTFYAQIIIARTHSVLKDYLPQTGELQAAQRRGRLPYNDLCLRLPDNKYGACLFKTLELLFDILCSYYRMMVCDWISQTQSFANGKLQRSLSQGSLNQPQGNRHSHSSSLGSIPSTDGADSSISQNGPVPGEDPGTTRDKLRLEVARAVGKGLEKGRKTVWELAARRVSALLSSDAICASSAHHFLQSLDFLNKFILAGEAFSGAEAMPLRAKLVKQSERYFGNFHRQNLEFLRAMVEKEPWQRVPSGLLKSLNLYALTGNGASDGITSTSSDSMMLKPGEKVELQPGFSEWLRNGNPFSESTIVGKVEANEGKMPTNNGNMVTKDEDEEDEELLADFIDEDNQRPSRLRNKSSIVDDEQVTLTSSSMNILRSMDRYARLMHVLEPINLEVFKGFCQIFELYFFFIFKIFGQRDIFSGRSPSDSPSVITSRLRGALVRISQQLEEQRLKYSTGNHQHPTGHVYEISSPQAFAAGIISPNNFFAIKERTVAAESLMFLVSTFKTSRPRVQSLLQQNALPFVEQFFARTVDAAADLRDHVYKTGARLLFNIGTYVDRIANTKWELKDLGTEHNGYVDLLLGEYKQYTVRLSNAGISKQVYELLLQYGVDIVAEALVEGLSRVKRCNNEGRALMSLDLQVLINGLQHLAPIKPKEKLQIVEIYIKAFYLPETEYLYWAKSHPEFSKAQIINLINLVATMNNWKRKTRTDLVERIENGEL